MEGQETILNKILNHRGLWPTILRLILEKMPNKDATRFASASKTAREAIALYRPEIRQVIWYLRHGGRAQALKVQGLTLPDRFNCLSATGHVYGLSQSCKVIARSCLNNGDQWDAKEILKAQRNFLNNGVREAKCFFAWYCLNIDDQQIYSFLSKDGFLACRGLQVRSFFTFFPCVIHQWIIKGQWEKFVNAMSFFTTDEKKNMFDERLDECWGCAGKQGEGSFGFAINRVDDLDDKRFYDYILAILDPEGEPMYNHPMYQRWFQRWKA